MSQFQNLTRKLTAAGHAKSHDGKFEYLLVVDDSGKDSSLSCQRWFGNDLIDEKIVARSVRPGSTAAYLTTLTDTFALCITPASSLRAYTFHERDREWRIADKKDKNAPPAYTVQENGKLAAVVDAGGRLHLVFQDSSDQIRYLDHSWNSNVLPVQSASGTPLAILAVADTVHVFYVSAENQCLHTVILQDNVWEDTVVLEQAFETQVQGFVAEEMQSGIELLVMMDDKSLLRINTPKSVATSNTPTRKSRRVHGCVNHAFNGTLADANLQFYLKRDGPSCLDKPGGDQGFTSLSAACVTGRLATVQLILQNGANPNALSSQKRTPLFLATSTKETRDRCAIVRTLLEAGASVDDAYVETGHATPLMNAVAVSCDRDVVVELLKHGADPNKGDNTWRTPAEVGREMGMADLFPDDNVESTVTSFGQSPVSPVGVNIPSTVETSVKMLSPDLRSPALKRSTRRISNQANHPPALESPAIEESGEQEKAPGEEEKPSAFEAKVIDFLAALLMLFVSYTGSAKVKELMDQAALKLANNGKADDEDGNRHS
ncbi:hypothetical protein D9619_006771 [Psilocybe cf. subviscida]|uniref:Uncharacterized protein n=1 Tax=Psilocybe cf. subviscida TaxID=2480587 RepID=A0A8H5EYI8_9AGAR|nr:hypothetical protein D9619_006771 [Psilocybe cf. subviscida]